MAKFINTFQFASFFTKTSVINGTDQADDLTGTDLADLINAGAGDDIVHGGNGNDTINGQAGNDQLFGDAGHDTLNGGDGNDILNGGEGNDTLAGGAGSDTLIGGNGVDTVSYATSAMGVMLDLTNGGVTNDASGDTYSGIENVTGSAFGSFGHPSSASSAFAFNGNLRPPRIPSSAVMSTRVTIVDTVPQAGRRKACKNDRVNGSYSSAGEHCEDGFWYHG
jgi:hypothetical protein